jgi:FtsH-binding integral membrane protein
MQLVITSLFCAVASSSPAFVIFTATHPALLYVAVFAMLAIEIAIFCC